MGLLTQAAKDALDDQSAMLAYLAEFDFTTGVERYWSGTWPLDYDGATWLGVGGLGRVGPVESSDDVRPNGLELEVLGLPVQAMRDGTLRAPQYKGRGARWIFALVDPEQDPAVIYAKTMHYYMDTMDYVVTPEGGGVRIALEHEVTAAARSSVRRYSHADQSAEYPGDKGFEYLAYLASGRSIRWGASGKFFVD